MTDDAGAIAFAAFREAVWGDFHLLSRLRPSKDRDAFVTEVVAVAATRGWRFDETIVRAAMRDGETNWLALGGDAI